MNHKNNQTRFLIAFFTLIAFSLPSQVKAMEMNEVQKAATDAVKSTFDTNAVKPWHQRVAEAVTKRLNTASEYVKNRIDDFTKAPRKYAVNEQHQVLIEGGDPVFDSNWISKAAQDRSGTGDQQTAIQELQGDKQNSAVKYDQEPAVLFREQDLAKAHRLDIQNASVADLVKLQPEYLEIILPELTPKQLSDMVQTPGYDGFPGNFISKLSPDQLIAVLKAKPAMFGSEVLSANVTRAQARAILQDSDVMEKLDLDADVKKALETKAKSVFQRALDALKPKKAAAGGAAGNPFDVTEGGYALAASVGAGDAGFASAQGQRPAAPAAAAGEVEGNPFAEVRAFDASTPQSAIQTGTVVADNSASGPIYQGVVKQASAAKAPEQAHAAEVNPFADEARASFQAPAQRRTAAADEDERDPFDVAPGDTFFPPKGSNLVK